MFRFPNRDADFIDDDLGIGGGGGSIPTLPTSPPSGEGYSGGGVMLANAYDNQAGFDWETCYVNNHPDLVREMPKWMPSIVHHYSNGYSATYYSSSVAQAGRHHYILYGYNERRIPSCPAAPDTTGPSLSSPSASVSPGTIGSGSTATLTASVTASDDAGVSGVTANGQQMVNSSGNTWSTTFSYPWSSSYASTTRTLSVTFVATDNNANTSSASASTELTYQAVPDTTAPSVGTPSASPSSLSFNDSSSSSQNVTISATVTDNESSASNLSVYFNGSTGSRSGSTFSRSFSVSKPSSLGTSYFSCSIYARDAAGNQSSTKSISVPIYRTDSTRPSITFNNPGNKTFSLAGSNTLRVYYTVVASDSSPSSGILSSSVTIPGATQYYATGTSYYFYEDFSRGNYGFSQTAVTRTATATDAAGNSRSASQTFYISINDDVDPTLGTLNHSGTVSIYTSGGTSSSNTARQYYNITATDSGRGISSRPTISGATYWYNSGTTYYYYEDFAYPDYSFSNTTVTRTATVTDYDGNSDSKSASFIVKRVDNSDPSITFYNPGSQEFTTNGSNTISVTYRVNVSDVGEGVSTVSIPGASRTSGSGSGNWYFTESFSKSSYNYSDTSVSKTATVTDGAGRTKSATQTFNIKIRDDAAPVLGNLVISSNPVLINTNPGTHTDVTYSITASDQGLGLSGNPTINGNASYSSSSGGTYYFTERFPYSDYGFTNSALSRTVTFTDGVNSSTKSVSFNVRRNDNQAPTLGTLNGPTTITIPTSGPGYTDALFSVTATDVGRGLVVAEPTIDGDGDFDSSLGTSYNFTERFRAEDYSFTGTPVTRTVTFQDDAGLTTTASRSFTVIREDDSFPNLTALVVSPNPVNIPISTGSKEATFTLIATDIGLGISDDPTIDGNGAFDEANGFSYSFKETFNAGDYGFSNSPITRTVTFTDGAGNQSTKSVTFNVKKVDDIAPSVGTLTISPNPVLIYLGGSNSTLATYTVTASDTGLGLSGNPTMNGNGEYVSKSGNTYTLTENFRFADYGFTNTRLSRTVTFTDGVQSTQKTVSFDVRKVDNVGPTITSFTRSPSAFTLSPSNTSQIVEFEVEVNDLVDGNVNTSRGINDDDVAVSGATFHNRSGNTWKFRKTYSFAGRAEGTVAETFTTDVQDAEGNAVAQNQSTTVTITTIDNQLPTNLEIFSNYDAGFNINEGKTDEPAGGLLIYVNALDVHNPIGNSGVTVTGAVTGATTKTIQPVFEDRTAETWTFRHKFASADYNYGTHSLVLTATITDSALAPNTATISSNPITFIRKDNQAPVIVEFTTNKNTLNLTQDNASDTVTYTVRATDVGSGISAVYIDDGAGNRISNIGTSSPFTYTETFNKNNFSYGSATRTRRAVVQDNTSITYSNSNKTITINRSDTADPVISNITVTPSSATLNNGESETFTIRANVNDNDSGISSVRFEGNLVTSFEPGVYSYQKTISFASLSNWGDNDFSVPIFAYDNQGNDSGNQFAEFTVTKVDNDAPVIQEITATPSIVNLYSSSRNTPVTVTFTARITDIGRGVDESTLSLTSASSTHASYKTKPSSGVYTFEKIYNFADFGFGASQLDRFTLNVRDAANNPAGSSTVDVTVNKYDNTAPTITEFTSSVTSVELKTLAPDNVKTVDFTVRASDVDSNIASVSVTGATQLNTSNPNAGVWYFRKTYNYDNYVLGQSALDTVNVIVSDGINTAQSQAGGPIFPININITKTDNKPPTITDFTVSNNVSLNNNNKYEINLDGNTTSKIVLFTATGIADAESGIKSVVLTSNNSNANAQLTEFLFPDPDPNVPGEPGGIDDPLGRDGNERNNIPGTYTWRMNFRYEDYSFSQSDVTFTLTVLDNANNSLTRQVTFDINKTDAVNPTINSVVIRDGATNNLIQSGNISLLTSAGETQQKTVKFIITASDNIGLDRIELDGEDDGFQQPTGTWTFTRTYQYSKFDFGTNGANLSAQAFDSQGNRSLPATTIPFNVIKTDDVFPVVSAISITHNGSAIDSNNRLVLKSSDTASKRVNFSFSVTEVGEGLGGDGFVRFNGVILTAQTGPDSNGVTTYSYNKDYSYSNFGGLGNYNDTILYDVEDDAGNRVASTAAVFIKVEDDTVPVVSTFSADTTLLEWKSNDADNANPGKKTVTFTATGISDPDGIGSVRVKYDTGLTDYITLTEGVSGTYTGTAEYSRPNSFVSRSFAASLLVEDSNGNENADKSVTLTSRYVDNTLPVISNKRISDINGNTITKITLDANTPSVTVIYRANISDNRQISNVKFSENGAESDPTTGKTGNNPREVTFNRTYSLASYNYQTGISASQISLNVSDGLQVTSSTFTALTIDVVDIVKPLLTSFTQAGNNFELTTANPSELVTWQVTGVRDNETGIKSVTLTSSDNSDTISGHNNDNALSTGIWNFRKTYNFANQSFGASKTDTILLTITDNNNNKTTRTRTVTYSKIDNEAPVVTLSANVTEVTVSNNQQIANVNFTMTVEDNVNIASVRFEGNQTNPVTSITEFVPVVGGTTRNYTARATYHYTNSSWLSFTNINQETFTFTASDGVFSTTKTKTITINKRDVIPPIIGLPMVTPLNKTVILNHQTSTADVVFRITATDNESGINKDATTVSSNGNHGTLISVEQEIITLPGGLGGGKVGDDFEVEPDPGIEEITITQYVITKRYSFNQQGLGFGSTTSEETITFFDNAGNQTSTDPIDIIIEKSDTLNPTLSNPQLSTNSISLYSENDGSQKTHQNVIFSVDASDESGIQLNSVKFNNPTLGDIVLTHSTGNTYTATKRFNFSGINSNGFDIASVQPGYSAIDYVWTAECRDNAGNRTVLDTFPNPKTLTVIRIDNTDPIISNFTSNGDDNGNVVLNDTITSKVVSFSATIRDTHRSIASVVFNYTGGPAGGQLVVSNNDIYSFTRTYNTAFTNYNVSRDEIITVTATDVAGNVATDSRTITVSRNDTSPPTINSFQAIVNYGNQNETVIYPGTGQVLLGTDNDNTDGYPQTRTVTFKLVAEDNVGIVDIENSLNYISRQGQALAQETTVTFNNALSDKPNNIYIWQAVFNKNNYSIVQGGNGQDQFRLRISDAAGNGNNNNNYVQQIIPLTVVVRDEVRPVILNVTSNLTNNRVTLNNKDGDGLPESKQVEITVQATDNDQISSVSCFSELFDSGNSPQPTTLFFTAVPGFPALIEPNIYKFRATYTYDDMPSFGDNLDRITVQAFDRGTNNVGPLSITHNTLQLNIVKQDVNPPVISNVRVRQHLAGVDSANTDMTNFKLYTNNSLGKPNSVTVAYMFDVSEDNNIDNITVSGANLFSGNVGGTGGSYVFTRTFTYNNLDDFGDNTIPVVIQVDDGGQQSEVTIIHTIAKIDNHLPTVTEIIARDENGSKITQIELLPENSPKTVTYEIHAYDNRGIDSVNWESGTANSSSTSEAALTGSDYNRNYQFRNQNNYIALRPGEKIYYFEKDYTFNSADLNQGNKTDNISVMVRDLANTTSLGDEDANSVTKTFNLTITTDDTIAPVISNLKANIKGDAPLIAISSGGSINLKTSDNPQTKEIQFRANISDNVVVNSVTARDKAGNSLTVSGPFSVGGGAKQYLCEKTYRYDQLDFGLFEEEIIWSASDLSNPASSASFFLNVNKIDDEKPVVVSFKAREGLATNSAEVTGVNLTTTAKNKDVYFHVEATDNRGVTSVGLVSSLFISNGLGANPVEEPIAGANNYVLKKTYNYDDYTFGDTSTPNHTDVLTLTVKDEANNTAIINGNLPQISIGINKTDNEDPEIVSIALESFTNLTDDDNNDLGTSPKIKLTSSQHISTNNSPELTFLVKVKDNVGIQSLTLGGAGDDFTRVGPNLPNTTSQELEFRFKKTFNFGDINFTRGTPLSLPYTATLIDTSNRQVTSTITLQVTKVDDTAPTISKFECRRSSNSALISDLNNTGSVILQSSAKEVPVIFTVVPRDDVDIASVVIDGEGIQQNGNNHPTNASPETAGNPAFTLQFTKTLDYDDFDSYGPAIPISFTCTVTNTHNLSVQETITINIDKRDNEPPVVSLTADHQEVTVHSESDGDKKTSETVIFSVTINDNVQVWNYFDITLGNAEPIVRTNEDEAANRIRFQKTYNYSDRLDVVPDLTYTDTLDLVVEDGGYYGDKQNRNVAPAKNITITINKKDNTSPSITELKINNSVRDTFSFELQSSGSKTTQLVIFHILTNDAQSTISQVNIGNTGAGGAPQLQDRDDTDISLGRYRYHKTYNYSDYTGLFGPDVAQDVITFQSKDANNNLSNTVTATINISRKDVDLPTASVVSKKNNVSTNQITISTSSPTDTIDIEVTAEDTDSGIHRVVMVRPATENRELETETIPANAAIENKYIFSNIEYKFSDYNTTQKTQNYTETIEFFVYDYGDNQIRLTHDINVERIENEPPTFTITTNPVEPTITLKNTEPTVNIAFTINASDNNGIGSVSMSDANGNQLNGNSQTANKTLTTFTKSFSYQSNILDRFGARGETLRFSATVTDIYGNSATDTIDVVVKQQNDRAPIIKEVEASSTSITLDQTNNSKEVFITVTASDLDFIAMGTNITVGHSLTTSLEKATIEKVDEEYGVSVDGQDNTYKFKWKLTYLDNVFNAHYSNRTPDGDGDLTDTITVSISDGTNIQTDSNTTITIVRNDSVDPSIKGVTVLSQVSPSFVNDVKQSSGNNVFEIKASEPNSYILRFQLKAKVIDNQSGLKTVVARYYRDTHPNEAVALSDDGASGNFTHVFPIEFNITDANIPWSENMNYIIKLEATDNAGRLSEFTRTIVLSKIDDVFPTITDINVEPESEIVNTSQAERDTDIIISFNCADDHRGIKSIEVTDENGNANIYQQQPDGDNNLKRFKRTIGFGELTQFGNNTFRHFINVTDNANQETSLETSNIIKKQDGNGPEISPSINNPTSVALHTTQDNINEFVTEKELTFTFNITDNKKVQSLEFKRGDTVINHLSIVPAIPSVATDANPVVATYKNIIKSTDSGISIGNNTVSYTLKATDEDGNDTESTTSITVTLEDNTDPILVSLSVPDGDDDFKLYSSNQPTKPNTKNIVFTTATRDEHSNIASATLSLINKNGVDITPQLIQTMNRQTRINGNNKIFEFSNYTINYSDLGAAFATYSWTFKTEVTDIHGNFSSTTKVITIDKMDNTHPTVTIRNASINGADITYPVGHSFEVNNQHVVGAEQKVYLRVEVDDAEGASNFTVSVPNFPNSTVQNLQANNHYLVILKYTFDDVNSLTDHTGNPSFPYNQIKNDTRVDIRVQQNSSNYRDELQMNESFNVPIKKMDTLPPQIIQFFPSRGHLRTEPISINAQDGVTETVNLTLSILDEFGDRMEGNNFGAIGNGDTDKIEITSQKLGIVSSSNQYTTIGGFTSETDDAPRGRSWNATIRLTYRESLFNLGENDDEITIRVVDKAGNIANGPEIFRKLETDNVTVENRGSDSKIYFNKVDAAGPLITNVSVPNNRISLLENDTPVEFTVSADITDRSGLSTTLPSMVAVNGFSITEIAGPAQVGDTFTWTCKVKASDLANNDGDLLNGFGHVDIPFEITALDSENNPTTKDDINVQVDKRDNTAPIIKDMMVLSDKNANTAPDSTGQLGTNQIQVGPNGACTLQLYATIEDNGVGIPGGTNPPAGFPSINDYIQLDRACGINTNKGFQFDIIGSSIGRVLHDHRYGGQSQPDIRVQWNITLRYSSSGGSSEGALNDFDFGTHPFQFQLSATDRHGNVGTATKDFTIKKAEFNAPGIAGFIIGFREKGETDTTLNPFLQDANLTVTLDNEENQNNTKQMQLRVNVSEGSSNTDTANASGVKSVKLEIIGDDNAGFGLPSHLERTGDEFTISNSTSSGNVSLYTYGTPQHGNVIYRYSGFSNVGKARFSAFGQYETTYRITATDNLGNVSTIERTITVDYVDSVAPTIDHYDIYQKTNTGFQLLDPANSIDIELGMNSPGTENLLYAVIRASDTGGTGINGGSISLTSSHEGFRSNDNGITKFHSNVAAEMPPNGNNVNTFKIDFEKLVRGNSQTRVDLGENTVRLTANVNDIAGNSATPQHRDINITVKDNEDPFVSFVMKKLNDSGTGLSQVSDRDAADVESTQENIKRIIEVTVQARFLPLAKFNDGTHNLTATSSVDRPSANLTEITNLDSYFGLTGTALNISQNVGNYFNQGGYASKKFYFAQIYRFSSLYAEFDSLGFNSHSFSNTGRVTGPLVSGTPDGANEYREATTSNGYQFRISDTTGPSISMDVYNVPYNAAHSDAEIAAAADLSSPLGDDELSVTLSQEGDRVNRVFIVTASDPTIPKNSANENSTGTFRDGVFQNDASPIRFIKGRSPAIIPIARTDDDIANDRYRFVAKYYYLEGQADDWRFYGTVNENNLAQASDITGATASAFKTIAVTKVDNVDPLVNSVSFAPASGTENVYTREIGNNKTSVNVVATITAQDDHSGVAKYFYSSDAGNSYTETTPSGSNTFTFVINSNEANTFGENNTNSKAFKIKVEDESGRESQVSDITYSYGKLDNTPPVITAITLGAVDTQQISNASPNADFDFQITVTDNSKANAQAHTGIQKVLMKTPADSANAFVEIWNKNTHAAGSGGKITATKSYDYNDLPTHITQDLWNHNNGSQGRHSLDAKFKVEDEAGNPSEEFGPVTFTLNVLDTVDPSISVSVSPTEHTISSISGAKTFDFTITPNDNETGIDASHFGNNMDGLTKKTGPFSETVYVEAVMEGEPYFKYWTDVDKTVEFSEIIYTGLSYKFIYLHGPHGSHHPWNISNAGWRTTTNDSNLNISYGDNSEQVLQKGGILEGSEINLSFNVDNGDVGGNGLGFIYWYCATHNFMIGTWPVRSGAPIVYQKTYTYSELTNGNNAGNANYHGNYQFDTERTLLDVRGHTKQFNISVKDLAGNTTGQLYPITLKVVDTENPTITSIKFYNATNITDANFSSTSGTPIPTGDALAARNDLEISEIEIDQGSETRVLILVQTTDGINGGGINSSSHSFVIPKNGGTDTLSVNNNDHVGTKGDSITFKHTFRAGSYNHLGVLSQNMTARVEDTAGNSVSLTQPINVKINETTAPDIVAWEVAMQAGGPTQNGDQEREEYTENVHHNYESGAQNVINGTGKITFRAWIRDEGGSGIETSTIKITDMETNTPVATYDDAINQIKTNQGPPVGHPAGNNDHLFLLWDLPVANFHPNTIDLNTVYERNYLLTVSDGHGNQTSLSLEDALNRSRVTGQVVPTSSNDLRHKSRPTVGNPGVQYPRYYGGALRISRNDGNPSVIQNVKLLDSNNNELEKVNGNYRINLLSSETDTGVLIYVEAEMQDTAGISAKGVSDNVDATKVSNFLNNGTAMNETSNNFEFEPNHPRTNAAENRYVFSRRYLYNDAPYSNIQLGNVNPVNIVLFSQDARQLELNTATNFVQRLDIGRFDDTNPVILSFTSNMDSNILDWGGPGSEATNITSEELVLTMVAKDNEDTDLTVELQSSTALAGQEISTETLSFVKGDTDAQGRTTYTYRKTFNKDDFTQNLTTTYSATIKDNAADTQNQTANSANSILTIKFVLLSIMSMAGSFSATGSLLSTADVVFNETLELLSEIKARSAADPGDAALPNHYIKIEMDVNSFVTRGQINNGGTQTFDDTFGLEQISIDNQNLKLTQQDGSPNSNVSFKLPYTSVENINMGSIQVANPNNVALANSNLSNVNINLKVTNPSTSNADALSNDYTTQNLITTEISITRADGSTDPLSAQTPEDATLASWLYFDDNNYDPNAPSYDQEGTLGFGANSFNAPTLDWLVDASSLDTNKIDKLEDKLSVSLSIDDIASHYATELNDFNNNFNQQKPITSWNLAINKVSNNQEKLPDNRGSRTNAERAFDQFVRHRLSGKSPNTARIFQNGDGFVTDSSFALQLQITDIDGNKHDIMRGNVFGLLVQKYDAEGEDTVIKKSDFE